jgi:hypothetical protein
MPALATDSIDFDYSNSNTDFDDDGLDDDYDA